MVTVEARPQKKRKRKLIRVGDGFASEAELRAKLRGNTGSMEPIIRDGDGLKVPPRLDDDGNPKPFLPSESWIDTYFTEIEDRDADGNAITVKWYDKGTASPLSSERRTTSPNMVHCRKCGRTTPPQTIEHPWTRPRRESPAMELLCTLPLAMATSVAVLAEDLDMGLSRTLRLIERLRKPFGLRLFRDADAADWVMIPDRHRERIVAATEEYWDGMGRGYMRPVELPAVCADCRAPSDHRFYPPSSSAPAFRQLGHLNLRIEETKLPPETKSELRREIKQFRRGKWRPR